MKSFDNSLYLKEAGTSVAMGKPKHVALFLKASKVKLQLFVNMHCSHIVGAIRLMSLMILFSSH